jgi:RND superfamily putative drug exporter
MRPKGFAARAGSWSARHRKTAILGWLAFVIVSIAVGGALGTQTQTTADQYSGEAGRAAHAVQDSDLKQKATEQVLIYSSKLDANSPGFRAAVSDVEQRLDKLPVVTKRENPYNSAGAISKDKHSALINFEIKGDADTATERIQPVIDQVEAAAKAHPSVRIEQAGTSSDLDIEDLYANDLGKAEVLSLPVTLVLLVLAFGALVAAGVPLLLALSAVMATVSLVAIPSQIFPVNDAISSVILLVGMAVGVDYSLFYMRRQREERAAGHDTHDSIVRAAGTSGRAVLVSGLTVMAAMAGMFLTGDGTFISFGIGTMMVVGVAMIGSLTVLPAMMAWLGDRMNRGRVPFTKRVSERPESGRGWSWVIDRVMRRPLVSAVAAASLLVALSIPAFSLHTQQTTLSDLPDGWSHIDSAELIQDKFPNEANAAQVVIQGDNLWSASSRGAILKFKQRAAQSKAVVGQIEDDYTRDGKLATLDVPLAGDGLDDESFTALRELRNEIIPSTLGKAEGVEVSTLGVTAGTEDFNSLMSSRMPLVFLFVMTLAFLLLLSTFRSIVIPIKAIVLNLLSVGAAYGTLVFVFQKGHFESLLGFESNGAIVSWLPMFLFVILFGLSMDYHVFILSRVREAYGRGLSNEQAVSLGIRQTAGVVTSAATVMVVTFAVFALIPIIDFKEMGIGLAAAVLIDATLIRAVLLPATMKLLGDRNWYLPRWLEWLPNLEHEPAPKGSPVLDAA